MFVFWARPLVLAAIVILMPAVGRAQAAPTPGGSTAASPSPSPSPTPVPGSIIWALDGKNVFVDQVTGGAGITPPEGAGFSNGSPLSPNTPYDVWSSAPQVPGLAGIVQYVATPRYSARRTYASADLGLGFVTGSVTNASYWAENLLPTYNPHLGNAALPYAIVFPANANSDRASAFRASVLGASAGAQDGSWTAKAGYFDLLQTNRFTFIQPTLTSVTPSINVAPAESLTSGPPSLSSWPSPEPGLPLLGVDVNARYHLASLEVSNAALPAPVGTSARATIGSIVVDHGEGTKYSAQFVQTTTGGNPIATTTLYGSDARVVPGPQGDLPVSTLRGQRSTTFGIGAAFHASKTVDALAEVGRQWYDADGVIAPGTQRPGSYYHVALTRKLRRMTGTVEAFRFEPRYATTILPYAIPENVWSSAWSWPGQWLKSTFELNDNTAIGVNRQGYRLKYNVDGGPLELHVQYANYRQIEEATYSNVHQTGFVDGFFLPQPDGFGTRGEQLQYASWLAWHPTFGTLTIDYVVDEEHRPATAARPQDLVNYEAPQLALTYSRQLSTAAVVSAGYGYYAMKGAWATTPIDFGEGTLFAGTELQESRQTGVLVQVRHNFFSGLPSLPGGPSPGFGANLLVVEQRIHF